MRNHPASAVSARRGLAQTRSLPRRVRVACRVFEDRQGAERSERRRSLFSGQVDRACLRDRHRRGRPAQRRVACSAEPSFASPRTETRDHRRRAVIRSGVDASNDGRAGRHVRRRNELRARPHRHDRGSVPRTSRPRDRTTWSLHPHWDLLSIIRIGGVALPAPRLLDGTYEDDHGELEGLRIGRPAVSDWTLVDRSKRAPDRAMISRFEGLFESPNMRAVATRKLTVQVAGIVPSEIYAFRRCVSGCDEPEGGDARVEYVDLIGPQAVWAGSTGETTAQPMLLGQAFTELTAPLRRESSASLSMVVTRESVAKFRGDAAPNTHDPRLSMFSLEVVWAEASGPGITFLRGTIDDDDDALRNVARTSTPPPVCVN